MALIPPFYLDCVVAIGTANSWIGTGFLVGRYFKTNHTGENEYHIFLVTNKHVIKGLNNIKIKFNPQNNSISKDYNIPLINTNGCLIWTGHPNSNIDVAAININPQILRNENMQFSYFKSDFDIYDKQKIGDIGVSEGDSVFVLGFPMGIVGAHRKYVIARSGSIARIRDLLESQNNNDFLIDSFVFPGNSGEPVILKPEFLSINGTKSHDKAALIGMVQSYIPYQDIAYSKQTQKPKVIFEENTGLASVIPTDFIIETINIIFHNNIKHLT